MNFSEKIFITTIIIAFISIIITTIGLIGSKKENKTLILIFGVIKALSTIVNFATLWIFLAVIDLIDTILAFAFAYLIGKEVGSTVNYA